MFFTVLNSMEACVFVKANTITEHARVLSQLIPSKFQVTSAAVPKLQTLSINLIFFGSCTNVPLIPDVACKVFFSLFLFFFFFFFLSLVLGSDQFCCFCLKLVLVLHSHPIISLTFLKHFFTCLLLRI